LRRYAYEELTARDKTSLDVFWLKDKSLVDMDNLPEPDERADQIMENQEAGLGSFREVLPALRQSLQSDQVTALSMAAGTCRTRSIESCSSLSTSIVRDVPLSPTRYMTRCRPLRLPRATCNVKRPSPISSRRLEPMT